MGNDRDTGDFMLFDDLAERTGGVGRPNRFDLPDRFGLELDARDTSCRGPLGAREPQPTGYLPKVHALTVTSPVRLLTEKPLI